MDFFITGFVSSRSFRVFHTRDSTHKHRATLVRRVVKGRGMIRTFNCRGHSSRHFTTVGRRLHSTDRGTIFCDDLAGPSAQYIGGVVCTNMTLTNTFLVPNNRLAINKLSMLLTCTGRCVGPFGSVDSIVARLRGTLTYTAEVFSLLRRRPRDPSPSKALISMGNTISVQGISFHCRTSGPLVGGFGLRARPNEHVTVMNPANYNGAAFVGLLVQFCSIANKDVSISKAPVASISERTLHKDCNVILRSA